MNDIERDRVQYWGAALAALQTADEFALVVLSADEDGQQACGVWNSSMATLPFFRDVLDRRYRDEGFQLGYDEDEDDLYDDE